MPTSRREPPPDRSSLASASSRELLELLLAAQGRSIIDQLEARESPEPLPRPERPVCITVRVDLDGAKPPIWRRLALAGDLTLIDLHDVLQAAMGWTDSHLHQFVMGPGARNLQKLPFLTPYAESEGDEGIAESEVRLDEVVAAAGDRLYYEYDFGDGWDHTIEVESVAPYDDNEPRARCVAGKRACPPEDVGGIGGYLDLLAALADPTSAEEWTLERLEWIGRDFDPGNFDVTEADDLVRRVVNGGSVSGLPSPDRLASGLRDVVERLDQDGVVRAAAWLSSGALDDVVLEVETAATLTSAWRALLDVVDDGISLTGAGYLRPADVVRLVDRLPFTHAPWGKGNREEHVRQVRELRETGTRLGLVRKSKGKLTVTAAGRKLADDPVALAHHVIARLPGGRGQAEEDTGWLVILAAAGGSESPYAHVADVLSGIGWRHGDGGDLLDQYDVRLLGGTARAVLSLAGWNPGPYPDLAHEPRARMLAQLAVRA